MSIPYFNLHSNMVLLILFAKIALQKFLKLFTFQYGSINTYISVTHPRMQMDLHSNMVLLIHFFPESLILCSSKFTFQYGSINTVWCSFRINNNSLFTFQYGSINTLFKCTPDYGGINLHSNMVLLIPILPALRQI